MKFIYYMLSHFKELCPSFPSMNWTNQLVVSVKDCIVPCFPSFIFFPDNIVFFRNRHTFVTHFSKSGISKAIDCKYILNKLKY